MDNVSLIVAALESVVIAGGQAALTDTVKEAFNGLKSRIVKRLAGKPHTAIVLDEYEQDPETWRKPLTELLLKASVAQDDEIIAQATHLLALTQPGLLGDKKTVNTFHEQVHYSPIGDNNTNTFHITNNALPTEDAETKGRANYKRGQKALLRKDYVAARKYLAQAEQQLDEDHLALEAAQVRYLQALALLNGQRPFLTTLQTIRRIEGLLRAALALQPLHSYYYALALFKHDFARNGLPDYKTDARDLGRQALRIKRTAIDEENLRLLVAEQPQLMQDSQHW